MNSSAEWGDISKTDLNIDWENLNLNWLAGKF